RVNERSLECRGVRVPLAGGGPEGRDLAVGIRPEHVEVSEAAVPGAWPGELMVAEPIGSRTLLTLKEGGEETRALAEPRDWPGRARCRSGSGRASPTPRRCRPRPGASSSR